MIQNEEFIQEFVDEAVVHAEKVEAALLKKETRNDKEVINDVFRAIHSIKGTAGFFGLRNIVALAHTMENVFGEIRSGKISLKDEYVDVLLAANDCLKHMIDNVMTSEDSDISELIAQLDNILTNGTDIGGGCLEQEGPAVADGNGQSLVPDQEEMKSAVEAAVLTFEPNKALKEPDHKSVKIEDNIRVNVSILNDLLNMASEMVLGRNQLLSTLESYRKSIPGLAPILQNIDRLTSGIQEKIMHTRMQPVGIVFNKFPRIIRDISKNLSKEVELILQGEDVELDKSIIEALTDPLTHLIRNSADHGLEVPDDRERAGKPRYGTIMLKAYHEGGYVNIDVADDGSGIDSDKIKKKALEKELVSQSDISKMSEQEILKLIFKPGFSTSEAITDISGRGVGMDVVRTNIEKLGGSIDIFTTKGEGTTIRLLLPLTLAIIQSLIVEVEGHKFALPQVNLKEIVKIKQGGGAHQLEYIHGAEVLRLRGHLLPIVHLADILGLERTSLETTNATQKRLASGKVQRVLVLKMGSRRFGIAVDAIVGSEETLVKPLPASLKQCICYSGVTIMGDGKTSMILDLEGIIRLSDLKFREETELRDEEELLMEAMEYQSLLLFKCSGSETFAIDLAMVSRVEEIQASDIERIGDKEYIKFRSHSLRVIRPEDFMSVTRQENGNGKLYVIIPKLVSHPIGILIRKIEDNINAKIILNTEEIRLDGLWGSTIYDNKIVLILNIYRLFEKAAPEYYATAQRTIDRKSTVLVAEDTPLFQKMEKEYLEKAGFEVTVAGNGREAFSILEKQSFDVIVSDIQMPGMDGFELVKKIRETPSLCHLPVIAVTSMTGEAHKKLGLEAGFDYYEAKLDRDKLLQTVEKALDRRKKAI